VKRWPAWVLAVALLSSCAHIGELRSDQVKIGSPRELETVTLPLTVEWDAQSLPAGAASYAIFVDRLPMEPGRDVRALADQACRLRRGCPDDAYLRTIGVYRTSTTKVVIPTLPTLGGIGSRTDLPVHQAIVVFLDQNGDRIGGYSSTVNFRFTR
jgi:hypothetical protein